MLYRNLNAFWQTTTSKKCQGLAWRLLLNRLPTQDNLIKCGVQIDAICVLCGKDLEIAVNIQFFVQGRSFKGRKVRALGLGIWVIVVWEIRQARNACIFRNDVRLLGDTVIYILLIVSPVHYIDVIKVDTPSALSI
ncbi:hypothetical protein VNO77_27712 [Canavalia gladiata]|uniref:Reverse transcriptase zinc-binding domain-containing protein n=1 Tax=Canavalia gladiata TaxID=3824 RepID=A0AAN9Q6R3_CANGL